MPNTGFIQPTAMPGAPLGGDNVAVPSAPVAGVSASVGQNPYAAPYPSGISMPPNIFSGMPMSTKDGQPYLGNSGYASGIEAILGPFIKGGLGYNPQVTTQLIQSMLSAMQPQIAQGAGNIMQQFAQQGLGGSSSAAEGLSNYYAQTNLDIGSLAAQTINSAYQGAIDNFMRIVTGGQGPSPSSAQSGLSTFTSLFGGGSLGGLLGGL